jgi:hypothetical protein
MLFNTMDHLGDGDLGKSIVAGIVIDNNDKNLRIKVRVSIMHQGVSDTDLPWCRPIWSKGSSSSSVDIDLPLIGSIAAIYIPSEDDNTNMYYLGAFPLDNSIPTIVASIFPNCDIRIDKVGNVWYTNFITNTIYMIHQSGAFFEINSSGITLLSIGDINLKAGGNINIDATGAVNITGSSVNLNPPSNPASSITSMPQPTPPALPNVSNLTDY